MSTTVSKSRVTRFLENGVRPLVRELKSVACGLSMGEFDFPVDDFAAVKFRCRSRREVNLTANFGFEKSALGAFLFLLHADDVVWDVGAAFGLFSIHSAKFCDKVIAFEPDPLSCERLIKNIDLNGQQEQISVQQIALSDKAGELELFTSGLSGLSPSLSGVSNHSGSVKVATKTIDSVVEAGTVPPDVIKIDVEGAEAQVLRGAKELLHGKNKPRLLFVEVHPEFLEAFGDSAELVEELVLEAGYELVTRERRLKQYHVVAMARDATPS